VLDRFSFVGRTLWVHALPGKTLSETAHELGGASFEAGAAGARGGGEAASAAVPLRLEVIDRVTGALRASMVYDQAHVRLRAVARGVVLRVGLPEQRTDSMPVDATWAVGALPGQALP